MIIGIDLTRCVTFKTNIIGIRNYLDQLNILFVIYLIYISNRRLTLNTYKSWPMFSPWIPPPPSSQLLPHTHSSTYPVQGRGIGGGGISGSSQPTRDSAIIEHLQELWTIPLGEENLGLPYFPE